MRVSTQRLLIYGILCVLITVSIYSWFSPCNDIVRSRMVREDAGKVEVADGAKKYTYSRETPIIFIGGVPRSGTTLMRAMLDAHPDIRCGEETRVIPRLLGMRSQWSKSAKESKRLMEAGLTDQVIDSALSAFILEIVARHGDAAPKLCNKDPFTLKSAFYLSKLFPNSKFLLMVRDGRAVVHSIIKRHVTISGFDLHDHGQCLSRWNDAVETMMTQCSKVGAARCLVVHYEQLVLHPEKIMREVLGFLNVDWTTDVLHHERFVGKKGGISLSKTERSTDQVIKPVNLDALTSWVEEFPINVRRKAASLAPMLSKLGYDPAKFPPNYGKPDSKVAQNTYEVHRQAAYWKKKADMFVKGEVNLTDTPS